MSDMILAGFVNAVRTSTESLHVPGLLGRRNANGSYTVEIATRPHWAYVRLTASGDPSSWAAVEAINLHVPMLENTPVRLTKVAGLWIVTGLDFSSPDVTSQHSNVPPHVHQRDNGLNQDVLDLDRMPSTLAGGAGQALIVNDDEDGFYIGNADSISGAVTSVNTQTGAVVLDADDIDDAATANKFATAAELSKLAGIEALADVTDAGNVGSAIDGATEATTIADANKFALIVAGVLNWISWANLKAVLQATFLTFTNKIAIAATATTGAALSVVRDLAAASTDAPVVTIHQDNAGDDQAALDVTQDGTGDVAVFKDGATTVLRVADGGRLDVLNIIRALTASGLRLEDDAGNLILFGQDATGYVGMQQAAPQVPLHVGAGTDVPAATLADIMGYFTRNGNTSIVIRNATNNVELIVAAGSTAGVFGTVTNHDLRLRANNFDYGIITAGGQTFFGGVTTGGASKLGVQAGSSSNDAAVGGRLYVNTTSAGNVGTGDDQLQGYTVPADTLSVNNQCLILEAQGGTAANGNTKTLSVWFGGSSFAAIALQLNVLQRWHIRVFLFRTGATSLKYTVVFTSNDTTDEATVLNGTHTATLSNSNALQVVGTATANDDVVCQWMTVDWHDANT